MRHSIIFGIFITIVLISQYVMAHPEGDKILAQQTLYEWANALEDGDPNKMTKILSSNFTSEFLDSQMMVDREQYLNALRPRTKLSFNMPGLRKQTTTL